MPPSSERSQPQKDYSAAFGESPIACPAPAPLTASNSKKWYKWGSSRSSSTASLLSTPATTSRPPTYSTPPVKAYEGASWTVDAYSRAGRRVVAKIAVTESTTLRILQHVDEEVDAGEDVFDVVDGENVQGEVISERKPSTVLRWMDRHVEDE
ncbi:hypothetical protein BU15DRAFT_68942 [Melanogaster broomeanus]|nr:hypothetical protein BU15DRAFT_68942 [Melanogaster broomeanus]